MMAGSSACSGIIDAFSGECLAIRIARLRLLSKEEQDRAIVDVNAAIAEDKRHAKASVNRGLAQMSRRRVERGATNFDEVVRLLANHPIGYVKLLSRLHNMGGTAAVSDPLRLKSVMVETRHRLG